MMNLSQAPEQGTMYALYRDKVVYRPYIRENLVLQEDEEKNLLELHLFDAKKEYRYVKMRKGTVETVISDATVMHEDQYVERIFTLDSKEKMREVYKGCVEIVNYITYDENDLMTIQNYRLKEV
ncbi:hypothetical protein [Mediterraneibacter sp.]